MTDSALADPKAASETLPITADGKAFGVWAPALTPLDADLRPDTAKALAYYRWLLDTGCHGLAFMGTNSEAPSFSVGERITLLEAALEAGIAPERLMVGTGCPALSDAVELTAHATKAGCSVLVLPAYYYKGITDDGLYANYAELIERVGDDKLRLFFYHFPKLSCVPVTHAAIERLLKAYPSVIKGLKDSSGDPEQCRAYIKAFPELAIFPGSEAFLVEMLKLGAAGTVTAGANVFCGGIRDVYDAYQASDPALECLDARSRAVRQVIQSHDMIAALKATVARAWNDPTWAQVRPPLVALDAETDARLAAELAAAGFAFGR